MRSPALAIGWELWARHRWGLSVIAVWAATSAVLARMLPKEIAENVVAAPSLVAACFGYVYLLWVFAYAENTLASTGAGFPPRLFGAPLRTSWLVAWPMFYGMAAAALVWLWLAWLVGYPLDSQTPANWPALLLAASMAAFQAACWTIVRGPIPRLVLAVFVLPLTTFMIAAASIRGIPERLRSEYALTWLVASLSVLIALSYLVAVRGVARDRRGDSLDAGWLAAFLARRRERLVARLSPRATPASAQRWLELRRHSWLVPMIAACYIVVVLCSLNLPLYPANMTHLVLPIVGLPPLLGLFLGFGMGKTTFWSGDLALSAFSATRPVTSAALAQAKLDAAAARAVRTWAYLLLLLPLALVATDTHHTVPRICMYAFDSDPNWKLVTAAVIALAGLVGMTWLHVLAGTFSSICGRVWLLNTTALAYVLATVAAGGLVQWIVVRGIVSFTPEYVLPLVVGFAAPACCLLLFKLGALAAVLKQPGHERTVPTLLAWLVIAACLIIPLYAAVPANPMPHWLVVMYVLLALPLNRPLLLPAAVAWNRHR
jgi:hypothetical protein